MISATPAKATPMPTAPTDEIRSQPSVAVSSAVHTGMVATISAALIVVVYSSAVYWI